MTRFIPFKSKVHLQAAMNKIHKIGGALFVASWVVLLAGAVGSFWWFSGATFIVLLLLSGIVFVFDFLSEKMRLQR